MYIPIQAFPSQPLPTSRRTTERIISLLLYEIIEIRGYLNNEINLEMYVMLQQ